MIKFDIPGNSIKEIEYLVFDFNGTIAVDGKIIQGVIPRFKEIGQNVKIFVITADTFGTVAEQLTGVNCEIEIITNENQHLAKRNFIEQLGKDKVIAFGNGMNDALMLQEAALGVCLIQNEGASTQTLQASDLIFNNILDALDTIQNSLRIKATLRT